MTYGLMKWKTATSCQQKGVFGRKKNLTNIKTYSPSIKSKTSSRTVTPPNDEQVLKNLVYEKEKSFYTTQSKNEERLLDILPKGMVQSHPSKANSNYINQINPNRNEFNGGEEDHFSKLYLDGKLRERKLEESQMIRERLEMDNCPFKPRLLKSSKSQSYLKLDRSSFFDSINQKLEEKEKRMQRLSQEKEKTLNSTCPFEPKLIKTNNSKAKNVEKMGFLQRVNFFKRSKEIKLHEKSKEYDVSGLERSKSAKKLHRTSSCSQTSFHERMSIDNAERQRKLIRLGEHVKKEEGVTFKPKLNEEKLRTISSGFMERNMQFVENKKMKVKSAVSQQDLECTFSPKINENSVNIALRKEDSFDYSNPGKSTTTIDRLQNYQKLYDMKKEELRESLKESYSFKPQLNTNTELILKNREEYIRNMNKRFERKFDKKLKKLSPDSKAKEKVEEIRNEMMQGVINNLEESKEALKKSGNTTDLIIEKIDSSKLYSHRSLSKNFSSSINPLKQESQQEFSKSKDAKLPFSLNNLHHLSDKQLMDLANNYITTDESLDQFKKTGKTVNDRSNLKISQNLTKEANPGNLNLTFKSINRKQLGKEYGLPKNVEKALEYYNIQQNN